MGEASRAAGLMPVVVQRATGFGLLAVIGFVRRDQFFATGIGLRNAMGAGVLGLVAIGSLQLGLQRGQLGPPVCAALSRSPNASTPNATAPSASKPNPTMSVVDSMWPVTARESRAAPIMKLAATTRLGSTWVNPCDAFMNAPPTQNIAEPANTINMVKRGAMPVLDTSP